MNDRSLRGFTLIEMLVVLLITGIASVLVLNMLTILLRGYDQIGRIQSDFAIDEMRFSWFRGCVGVMVASLDKEFAFAGSSREISGYTTSPLIGKEGKLTWVKWELKSVSGGDEIWYTEGLLDSMHIGTWKDTELEFLYRGLNSDWRRDWPPSDLRPGVLPYRIKLRMTGAVQREFFAAIRVRRTGRYDYRDFVE